tara:strand:- start:239 stop:583 length:345 start_codon:yes stop_codon:yes gene_type:complete
VPSEQQRLSLVLNVYYTIDWVRCPAKSLENIRDEMEDVPNAEEETGDAEHSVLDYRHESPDECECYNVLSNFYHVYIIPYLAAIVKGFSLIFFTTREEALTPVSHAKYRVIALT